MKVKAISGAQELKGTLNDLEEAEHTYHEAQMKLRSLQFELLERVLASEPGVQRYCLKVDRTKLRRILRDQ